MYMIMITYHFSFLTKFKLFLLVFNLKSDTVGFFNNQLGWGLGRVVETNSIINEISVWNSYAIRILKYVYLFYRVVS